MEADRTTPGAAKSGKTSTAVSILIFNIYIKLEFPIPVSYIQLRQEKKIKSTGWNGYFFLM